jgi:tetratricopeptide (TPR) repeat protein
VEELEGGALPDGGSRLAGTAGALAGHRWLAWCGVGLELAAIAVLLVMLAWGALRIEGALTRNDGAETRLVALGDRWMAEGDSEGAVTAYSRALAIVRSPAVEGKLAEARLRTVAENPDRLGAFAVADIEFDRKWLVSADPAAYGALSHAVMGQLALARGEVGQAEAEFRRAAESGSAPGPAMLGLAMVALARNDPSRARDAFAAAAAALPGSAYAQAMHGDACLAGEPGKAEAAYVAALKLRDVASAHRGLAKIRLASNDVPGGIAELRRAVAADGRDFESLASLGSLLAASGALDDADRALEDAYALRKDAGVATARTRVLLRLGRPQEAIRVAESHSLDSVDPVPPLRLDLASAYEMIGDLGAAFMEYTELAGDLKVATSNIDPADARRFLDEIEARLDRLAQGGPSGERRP